MPENSDVRQAVILAGGKATRMRPHTDDRPKAMVEVAGSPIVEHQIRWLQRNGVSEIVLSCGYMADVLSSHLGDGSALGVRLTYAVEDVPLGRGGGLKFGASHLGRLGEPWLGLNGDVVCDFPLNEMVRQHLETGVIATIALAQYRTTWGIADLEGQLVKGFLQSPKLPYWINGGVYCFQPGISGMLPETGDHEDSTFPDLARKGQLGGYKIDGYWRGIDTAKDILEATAELSNR